MIITSFVLGVSISIVVVMSIVMFILYIKIKNLQKHINFIHATEENIIRDNTALERRLIDSTDQLRNHTHDETIKTYRYVDSRTDGLEAKMYKNFDIFRIQGKNY